MYKLNFNFFMIFPNIRHDNHENHDFAWFSMILYRTEKMCEHFLLYKVHEIYT